MSSLNFEFGQAVFCWTVTYFFRLNENVLRLSIFHVPLAPTQSKLGGDD